MMCVKTTPVWIKLLVLLAVGHPLSAQGGRVLENRTFFSPSLEGEWSYSVYLPPGYDVEERAYLTVYLLHGYGGDHTNWVRLGDAALTADSLIAAGVLPPLILVMPDGRNSFYVDSDPAKGFGAVETALVRDLVPHVDRSFRSIARRRGRMIAGLSMGGYGALHLAFKHPELFGAAASLSGAHPRDAPERRDLFVPAFGDPFDPGKWNEENPLSWVPHLEESGLSLPVFLSVGDDDAPWIYEGAVEVYTTLRERELPAELRITDGPHSWDVWDAALGETLLFFSEVFRARYR